MILFDLLINKRRINLFEIILIIFLTCSIVLTFIGDKIWNEDDYLREIHHRDSHIFHRKNLQTYRKESNVSQVSNQDENFNDHDHRPKNEIPNEEDKRLNAKISDHKNLAIPAAEN